MELKLWIQDGTIYLEYGYLPSIETIQADLRKTFNSTEGFIIKVKADVSDLGHAEPPPPAEGKEARDE